MAAPAASPDVFVAGVIQGSERRRRIVAQEYRNVIREIVRETHPTLTVYDPLANHPDALDYTPDQARETFFGHIELVRQCRLLVAYLPEASLGTAIEMWEAYHRAIPVVAISSMSANWVIQLLSSAVCPDLDAFARWVAAGSLGELLEARSGRRPAPPRD